MTDWLQRPEDQGFLTCVFHDLYHGLLQVSRIRPGRPKYTFASLPTLGTRNCRHGVGTMGDREDPDHLRGMSQ